MTKIIGHRGGRALWPENSALGFRNAVELAIDAVEFDVHLTDAGELLVIHDATLDRTTTGSGPVRLLTPSTRATVNVRGTDEPVPTLDEVLEIVAGKPGLEMHVEIKADPEGRPYPGLPSRIAAALSRFRCLERSHLTSFDEAVLEDCRRFVPSVPRLVSVNAAWAERQGGLDRFLLRLRDLVDIVAVEHTLLAAEWDAVTSRVPTARLCAWTVNDAPVIAALLKRGVGHLTSDDPVLALATRAEFA